MECRAILTPPARASRPADVPDTLDACTSAAAPGRLRALRAPLRVGAAVPWVLGVGTALVAGVAGVPASLAAQAGGATAASSGAAAAVESPRGSVSVAPSRVSAAVSGSAVRSPATPERPEWEALARRVEVRRTRHGVPHILAEDLRSAFYAMGYVQLEDYGDRVPRGLVEARGEAARWVDPAEVESDLLRRQSFERALETYALLSQDLRDVYEGFAAGVNRYIELHPDEFEPGLRRTYTGVDVHARSVSPPAFRSGRRVLERLADSAAAQPEDGSNAWALAPERTESGHAILLRNPHLSWSAGYYEAHVTVPGVLNFYGDFRIGGPFGIIGGFNDRLAWATTNNQVDSDEVYALRLDPERPDHVLLDGGSVPLRRELVTVHRRSGDGLVSVTRPFWFSPLGPVISREGGLVHVVRDTNAGEYRVGEQFLAMMRAQSLEAWNDAMRVHARGASNFTYADADGNICLVWNARLPELPHPPTSDTLATTIERTSDAWTAVVPWDSLPRVCNPPGGYVHNENDPFHYANLNVPMDPADWPANMPEPRLRLRSQHGLELIANPDDRLSLEEVVRRKHSYRMLLAERVIEDLLAAVRGGGGDGDARDGAEVLAAWDRTVAPESRGGVLFEAWWDAYTDDLRDETGSGGGDAVDAGPFARPWTPADPTGTPRGLARPDLAVAALSQAAREVRERWGRLDVAWGEVHRVRRGAVDAAVGGCSGSLGCFRVLNFDDAPDGRRVADGGDGWVLAVELGEVPRAYSVLAYGQSDRPDSRWHDDQAAMFARGEMKRAAFTEEQIAADLVERYRPGLARR